MFAKRTDLALEARELWQESAEKTSRLSGVKAAKTKLEGYPLTRADILNEKGGACVGTRKTGTGAGSDAPQSRDQAA